MKKIFILLLLSGLFLNCSSPKRVDIEKLQNRNGLLYEINSQTPYSGIGESYYKNGQLRIEQNFKNGKLDGNQKNYYKSGQLESEGTYKNGEQDGIQRHYYENGQLESEGNYKNGEQDGIQKHYHDNGKPKLALSPKEVVQKVMDVTKEFDFKSAKKYVAKEHMAALDAVIAEMETPEAKAGISMMKGMLRDAKFEVISETISEDGNTAIVVTKVTVMGESNEDSWPLIKENGVWKVNRPIEEGK